MTEGDRYTATGVEDLVVPEVDIYRTPLLPGFELPLASLLAAADRWAAPLVQSFDR